MPKCVALHCLRKPIAEVMRATSVGYGRSIKANTSWLAFETNQMLAGLCVRHKDSYTAIELGVA